jgi:hypothetical protein
VELAVATKVGHSSEGFPKWLYPVAGGLVVGLLLVLLWRCGFRVTVQKRL